MPAYTNAVQRAHNTPSGRFEGFFLARVEGDSESRQNGTKLTIVGLDSILVARDAKLANHSTT